MNEPRNYHTMWSKSGIYGQMPCDITYTWNPKYNLSEETYLWNKPKHREQTCGCQRGVGGGHLEWEFEISRANYYIQAGWTIRSYLPHSTGNYIQFPVINHNGKNMKMNVCVCVCVCVSLCYTWETNKILEINYTSIQKKGQNSKSKKKIIRKM